MFGYKQGFCLLVTLKLLFSLRIGCNKDTLNMTLLQQGRCDGIKNIRCTVSWFASGTFGLHWIGSPTQGYNVEITHSVNQLHK